MAQVILTSSVLILLLILLRVLLQGRISLRLQYALWALVAARLLVPVSFGGSALSVLNAADFVGHQAQAVWPEEHDAPTVPVQTGASFSPLEIDPAAPQAPSAETTVPSHPGPTPQLAAKSSAGAFLTAAWLTGGMGMALWLLCVNLAFRRRLRTSARQMAAPGYPLPVFVAEGIPSPCLAGLVRPAVYLTPACLEDPARLRHVLAHELTHWRHRDPWWSLARCLCLCLYWFDPLVWLAASLSRRDCELACDEGALVRLGEEERMAYGRTLIDLTAVSASPARLLQTATTMADRKRGIRERITLITRRPKMPAVTAGAVVLIAAAAVACTFTGAQPDGPSLAEQLSAPPQELAEAVTLTQGAGDNADAALLTAVHTATRALQRADGAEDGGWLCSLYRFDQAAFEAAFLSGGDTSGLTCFARDDSAYYTLRTPTDVQWAEATRPDYEAAYDACVAWVKETVLAQPGVEPYDPAEVLDRPYTYDGMHMDVLYLPYLHVTGDAALQYGLVLSQPATQGEDGIWCVERWSDGTTVYLVRPDTDQPSADYYTALQSQADEGRQAALLDPLQVCQTFVQDHLGHSYAQTDSFQLGAPYDSQDQPGGSPQLLQLAQAAGEDTIDRRLAGILLYKDPPTEAETAAQLFAHTAAQELLNIPKSQAEAVVQAEVADVTLLSHADGKLVFQFTLAVVPADPSCTPWQGADLAEGTGQWEGCGLYTRTAALLYHSTAWHCTSIARTMP